MKKREAVLILENIRSSENAGSLFRTADAAGIARVYCVGITPTPRDRFDRENKKFTKASLGAEKTLFWAHAKNIQTLIRNLKEERFYIIAIEQGKNAKHYARIRPKTKTAFILGSETQGISRKALNLSHVIAEIPMKGKKESLNVSVAGGIALFRILGV